MAKSKVKGGGTTKVCLPASKVRSMSAAEKKKVINAKKSAASKGKYKRSSKSNVKGARKKGATLRDWFEKEKVKKRGGAYRGTLKARINKLYGGDVTCSKVSKLKSRQGATKRDVQLANWFINMHDCGRKKT